MRRPPRPSPPLRLPTARAPGRARRLAPAMLLAALAVSGGAGLLPGSAGSVAAEATRPTTPPRTRPGLHVRFAALDGQSGLQGNAFLLFSSRRISLDAPPRSGCGGARVVRAEARGSRGLVRKLALTLHLRAPGTLTVQADGCPRAELRAELEDGTVLSGGEGTVEVQAATLASGGAVSATYSWTATRDGAPFPMRGDFNFTLP